MKANKNTIGLFLYTIASVVLLVGMIMRPMTPLPTGKVATEKEAMVIENKVETPAGETSPATTDVPPE